MTSEPFAHQLRRAVKVGLSSFDDVIGPDPETVWSVLADADALGIGAPLALGGLELGLRNAVSVDLELGRRCLPDVHQGAALVADALTGRPDPLGLGSAAVTGKLQVAVTGLDRVAARGVADAPVRGHRTADGWQVQGEVSMDRATGRSTACAVAVSDGVEVHLLLVPPEIHAQRQEGPVPGTDTVRLDLWVSNDAVIGQLGQGEPLTDPSGLLERARLRHAAYLVGLATGAHELAVSHVSRRRQFGKPLVEFQGVAFPLARAAVELQAAELAIRRLAGRQDARQRDPLGAVETLAFSAETAMRTIRAAMQFHGAIGLTSAAPISAYYLAVRREQSRFGAVPALWREAGARRLSQAEQPAP